MSVQFSADNQAYTSTAGLPGSAYTVIAWIFLSVDRNAGSTLWVYNAGGTNGHNIATTADGTTIGMDAVGGVFSAGSLTAGAWTKVALVANGTTATIYTGAPGAALSSTSGTIPILTMTDLFIGAFNNATSGSWLNGRVANFKVYNAALSATEIAVELAQYVPTRTANLTRWHPFLVAETADYSANGFTLSAGTGTTTAAGPPIPWTVVPQSFSRVPVNRANQW